MDLAASVVSKYSAWKVRRGECSNQGARENCRTERKAIVI